MSSLAQKRALEAYRARLTRRGLVRFEVLGLETDRALVRAVARRLSQDDAEAVRLREQMTKAIAAETPRRRGGILAALRRSPLVGADLDLTRTVTDERKVEL